MRIVSYNILEGGIGRADPIAEVLLAQRPDVVGLVEADDPEVLARIAWRLGFDYVAAAGREGRTAALLTRGTIVESINHVALCEDEADCPRSLLEALVEIDGKRLRFGVVHLTAKPAEEKEQQREREVASVLSAFARARDANEPHVLMGDFNATSPVQVLQRDELPEKVRKHVGENGGDLPRRAMARLLDAGYLDTLATHAPDDARTAASFTTLEPGLRYDYLLAHGIAADRIRDAWIERDRLATFASDHFPVGVELSVG